MLARRKAAGAKSARGCMSQVRRARRIREPLRHGLDGRRLPPPPAPINVLWHGVTTLWPAEARRLFLSRARACLPSGGGRVMSSKRKRDQLQKEIFDSLSPPHIYSAAGLMMGRQHGNEPIEPGREAVIRFIESLDVRGLESCAAWRRGWNATRRTSATAWAARPCRHTDTPTQVTAPSASFPSRAHANRYFALRVPATKRAGATGFHRNPARYGITSSAVAKSVPGW